MKATTKTVDEVPMQSTDTTPIPTSWLVRLLAGAVFFLLGAGGGQFIRPNITIPTEFTDTQTELAQELTEAVETLQMAYIRLDEKHEASESRIALLDSTIQAQAQLQQEGFAAVWSKLEAVDDIRAQNELIISLLKDE